MAHKNTVETDHESSLIQAVYKYIKRSEHAGSLMELYESISTNMMEHLWDEENQQFVPHRYLEDSPYPEGFFMNEGMYPYGYQNGRDWDWFGGRMIKQLNRHGFVQEAYDEAIPCLKGLLRTTAFTNGTPPKMIRWDPGCSEDRPMYCTPPSKCLKNGLKTTSEDILKKTDMRSLIRFFLMGWRFFDSRQKSTVWVSE